MARNKTGHGALEGKANRRNPANGSAEESDGDVVPGKLANKGEQPPAESMEGRKPTKRNSQKEATHRVQDRAPRKPSGIDL